jgi:hypothetical protein
MLGLTTIVMQDIPVRRVETTNDDHRIFAKLDLKNGNRGRTSAVTYAPKITATANAIVPSTVFFTRGHRLVPYFFPTILACDQRLTRRRGYHRIPTSQAQNPAEALNRKSVRWMSAPI